MGRRVRGPFPRAFCPILVFLCLVLWMGAAPFVSSRQHRLRSHYRQYDALVVARCDAKCWNVHAHHRQQCVKQCLAAGDSKPGECPKQDSLSVFDAACLEACKLDTQCPGVSKCCRHRCGVTCQTAIGLEHVTSVPRIPTDISVSERRKGRTLYIRWNGSEHMDTNSEVLYVLEERHHAGSIFTESRLGAWTPRHRSNKTSVRLKNLVKPGRWYQFRVAAVNQHGSRGYSENSKEFITSLGPRPPAAPPNMTVGPLKAFNGSLWGELRWDPPASDLPIQRYKVFWSRRLHGATALNSVLVQHQTVPKDVTRFDLKNLQPNSLYFLQVQALAQFGKERLKGEKAALVLNTTNHTNVTDSFKNFGYSDESSETRRKKWSGKGTGKIEGLHIQKVFWSKDQLLAKIAWKMKKPNLKYTVTWWAGPCKNSNTSTHLQLAVTTKSAHYNIYNLDFECRYQVTVTSSEGQGGSFEGASTSFSTASCEEFTKNVQKDKPNCLLRAKH